MIGTGFGMRHRAFNREKEGLYCIAFVIIPMDGKRLSIYIQLNRYEINDQKIQNDDDSADGCRK